MERAKQITILSTPGIPGSFTVVLYLASMLMGAISPERNRGPANQPAAEDEEERGAVRSKRAAEIRAKGCAPRDCGVPDRSREAEADIGREGEAEEMVAPVSLANKRNVVCLNRRAADRRFRVGRSLLQPTTATSFPQPPPLPPVALDRCSTRAQPLIPCYNNRYPLPRSHHHPTQRRTAADHLCSSSPHLSSASLRQCTTLVATATHWSSLFFTCLLSQHTHASVVATSAISLPPLSSLSPLPCCRYHYIPCSQSSVAITDHNRYPSPISSSASSVAITASPYRCNLLPIVAASSLVAATLVATVISNYALAAAPPWCCRCNSLLPLLPPPSPTSFSIYW
ncbi:hypothetical protein BHE74_00049358 [Ensete ventricosum]|nr:hypothetical protein BHE74_00049358 [Ensete ventricosum]